MEARDERDPEADHGCPHDERAQDAPDQNPVLVLGRHPEVGKDEPENENIIDAERVLDQVAGEEVERLLGPLPPPDEEVEA